TRPPTRTSGPAIRSARAAPRSARSPAGRDATPATSTCARSSSWTNWRARSNSRRDRSPPEPQAREGTMSIDQTRQLFYAGPPTEATAAAAEEVRKQASDLAARLFLTELLCFAGDLERADKQLDLISSQDPKQGYGVALVRQLIRAEQARQQLFTEGRLPEF